MGDETILVVDDDAAVRGALSRMLARLGYHVLGAANGADALHVSGQFEAPIDLVIADAMIPGSNGGTVIRSLVQQRPPLRALLMSGYSADELERRGISSGAAPFLSKPFSMSSLAHCIRAALDRA